MLVTNPLGNNCSRKIGNKGKINIENKIDIIDAPVPKKNNCHRQTTR